MARTTLIAVWQRKLLTAEDEVLLGKRIQGDDPADSQAAMQELVEHNLGWAVKLASQRHRTLPPDVQSQVRLEHLCQEAYRGVWHAASKFDPNRGYKFSTYATWWIRKYIGAYLDKERKERHIAYYDELGPDWYDVVQPLMSGLPRPEQVTVATAMRDLLLEKLGELNMGQEAVVIMRFGLDGAKPLSFIQIGRRLKKGADTVERWHDKAMVELRAILGDQFFIDFVEGMNVA